MPTVVEVDDHMCEAIASALKQFTIPADVEDTSIEGIDASRLANFYFLLVAICHQTQSLQGIVNGTNHRGWDYLRLRLLTEVTADNELLQPKTWKQTTAASLAKLFRDDQHGDTLTDTEGRAALIRDLGLQFESQSMDSANDLYLASGGRLAGESSGLLSRVSKFRAYSDPVQKKSFFFLGLMRNSGTWEYADEMELGAPVDYHEVRGHLRMGTVRICRDLQATLAAKGLVSQAEDVAIRSAVGQAITRVASLTGHSPMQLHYLFWNVFRNVCLRENPRCFSVDPSITVPPRYRQFIENGRCPFADSCTSAGVSTSLIEHSFHTDWY